MLENPPLLESLAALGFDDVARSIEGRPIWAGTYRGGKGGRRGASQTIAEDAGVEGAGRSPLLIVGGVHGDEPSSVEAVVELVHRLGVGDVAAPPLVIVPALNPDGVGRNLKNSARDVDLNRNFPARNWQAAHAPGYFPGSAPLSEPETQALAALVERHAPRGVVAVHAPFACVNYDGPPSAAAWAAEVAAACGWPARGDIGYPTPGSLGSWLGIDLGLPVLTLELPPGPLAAFRRQAAAALDAAILPATPLTRRL